MARPNLTEGDAHRACVNQGECRPAHRSTKNRRDWCKGREGIPHTWEWMPWKHQLELEQRYGGPLWNRVTEHRTCFGCGKEDDRTRSFCRQCGAPWPKLTYEGRGPLFRHGGCPSCFVPWRVERDGKSQQWHASGSVVGGS